MFMVVLRNYVYCLNLISAKNAALDRALKGPFEIEIEVASSSEMKSRSADSNKTLETRV